MRDGSGQVAVLGGSGFLGGAIGSELRARGVPVRTVTAPRLRWHPESAADPDPAVVDDLASRLDGASVVVNAAGLADPAAPPTPDLFGANALLPLVTARAAALAGAARLVHVSSIAVQDAGDLDETDRTAPGSPYARARALGERLLLDQDAVETVVFRPTSVHGTGRAVTRSLVRLARSAASCVAGTGASPTPQVLVQDVAASIAYLATATAVPRIAIQPSCGMTTGMLLRLLGGREPRHVPVALARYGVRAMRACASVNPRARAHAKRVEMLLFGRRQVDGWLAEHGLAPTLRPDAWRHLAESVAP